MSSVTRSRRALLLLTVLAAACKGAGPKAPPSAPAPPDMLRRYESDLRVLRHKGDERALTHGARDRLSGDCDVAVRVRRAAFETGAARFSLDTVGLPNAGGRDPTCKRMQAGMQLAITGFTSSPEVSEVTARVDEVLQTPEAYLRSKGVAFDRPSGKPPTEVASEVADATQEEQTVARDVTVWPRMLLSVNPFYRDPKRRVRHEGLVEAEAIVGTDGRLHRPRLKTSLGDAYEGTALSALSFWRFEPARRGGVPVGARIPLRLVLRIY